MERVLAHVEGMLDADARLEQIETYIDTLTWLGEDMRSALWLCAWAQAPRQQDARAAHDRLAPIVGDLT